MQDNRQNKAGVHDAGLVVASTVVIVYPITPNSTRMIEPPTWPMPPRALDERLVARPLDWQATTEQNYAIYLAKLEAHIATC